MLVYIVVLPFILSLILLCYGGKHLMSRYEALAFIMPAVLSAILAVYIRTYWLVYSIQYNVLAWEWLDYLGVSLSWEVSVNLVTLNMLCLVNLVGTCVLSFSLKYMEGEKTLNVFMAYVYAFIGFMNILVVANSLFQFFLGWEGIGICSFLLISFWQEREEAVTASFKAMIVNKLGDVSFMVGATILFTNMGFSSFECLNGLALFSENRLVIASACGWFLLSVFCKSAQIIFHVWLPEAMEGPTPVSALIHAATMVTAGNLLVIKTSPMWVSCPSLSQILMSFGGVTCIFSSIIAINQSDIKKVVAYSTCSQLGYMVLSCGINLYQESLNHCMSHGFFKALLFLSAGWTIHVYKHEQRDEKMGMKSVLSIEFIGFLIGSGALVAIPMTAGWYTKEAIIEGCVNGNVSNLMSLAAWAAAVLTSLYSTKVLLSAYFYLPSKNDIVKLYSREIKGNAQFKTSLYALVPLVLLSHYAILYGYNYLEGNTENPNGHFVLSLSILQIINSIAYLIFVILMLRRAIWIILRGCICIWDALRYVVRDKFKEGFKKLPVKNVKTLFKVLSKILLLSLYLYIAVDLVLFLAGDRCTRETKLSFIITGFQVALLISMGYLKLNYEYIFLGAKKISSTYSYKVKIWGKLAGLFGPFYSRLAELNQGIFAGVNTKLELISYGPIVEFISTIKTRVKKLWKFLVNNIPLWPSMAIYHIMIILTIGLLIGL